MKPVEFAENTKITYNNKERYKIGILLEALVKYDVKSKAAHFKTIGSIVALVTSCYILGQVLHRKCN